MDVQPRSLFVVLNLTKDGTSALEFSFRPGVVAHPGLTLEKCIKKLEALGNSLLADLCEPGMVAAGMEALQLLYLMNAKDAPEDLNAYQGHDIVKGFVEHVPLLFVETETLAEKDDEDNSKVKKMYGQEAAAYFTAKMLDNVKGCSGMQAGILCF